MIFYIFRKDLCSNSRKTWQNLNLFYFCFFCVFWFILTFFLNQDEHLQAIWCSLHWITLAMLLRRLPAWEIVHGSFSLTLGTFLSEIDFQFCRKFLILTFFFLTLIRNFRWFLFLLRFLLKDIFLLLFLVFAFLKIVLRILNTASFLFHFLLIFYAFQCHKPFFLFMVRYFLPFF